MREHWGWVTASGSYKVTDCLNILEEWEERGPLGQGWVQSG